MAVTSRLDATDRGGAALCWGSNGGGRLGTGDHEDRLVPTPVLDP